MFKAIYSLNIYRNFFLRSISIFQTVTPVLWYLHQVARDAELQERLRKSILESPNEYENGLVRACLREVLRLYPVATFVGRILDSEANVNEYTIPKGWLAIMSLYSSGRDPENFSEPSKFAPDRWLREGNGTDYKVYKPHGTIPFAVEFGFHFIQHIFARKDAC